MKNLKVIKVSTDYIEFEGGVKVGSSHESDCCEQHYLSFGHLSVEDFEGLEFNLFGDNFFEKVEEFGIRLIPNNGHPVSIPGYGFNNGYYSTDLTLTIFDQTGLLREYDITECQTIED